MAACQGSPRRPGGPTGPSAEFALFVDRLVHYIPAVDTALVPAHDGGDVVFNSLERRFSIQWLIALAAKRPGGRLIVPHQRVTDDEHAVLLAPVDILIGGREVVLVRLGMHLGPLEEVLRRDCVAVPRRQLERRRLLAHDLVGAEGDADAKRVAKRFFQRRRFVGLARHRRDRRGGDSARHQVKQLHGQSSKVAAIKSPPLGAARPARRQSQA
jgi:hypothetical protein